MGSGDGGEKIKTKKGGEKKNIKRRKKGVFKLCVVESHEEIFLL